MELLEKMVEHHVWLTGEMVRLAGRLTDDQLDETIGLAVDDDEQTIRSLLCRLIGQMGMWNAAMATRDYDWARRGARDARLDARSGSASRDRATSPMCARSATDGRSSDTFVDALCEPAEVFTYGGMIAHVLTFAAHRRTLVVLAFGQPRHRGAGLGRPDEVGGPAGLSRAARHNGRVEIAFLLVALAVGVLAVTALADGSTSRRRSC